MSFFHWTTLIAVAVIAVAALTGHGETRLVQIEAIAITYVVIFSCGVTVIGMQFFVPTVCRGATGHQQVALTFDDGPDPAATPALLDYLKQENISAAFFCIGRNVVAYPEIARRIVDDGHLIGNHSFNHSWTLNFNRSRGLANEFGKAAEAIARITGSSPTLLRPPVGLTNPHFPWAMKQLGVTIVGWNVRPFDTVRPAKKVIRHVLAKAKDGSIIVLHDGGSTPEKILEIVIAVVKELRAKGYQFERVDRMI